MKEKIGNFEGGGIEEQAREYIEKMNLQRAGAVEENTGGKIEAARVNNYLCGNIEDVRAYQEKYKTILGGYVFDIIADDFAYKTQDKRNWKYDNSEALKSDMFDKQSKLLKARHEHEGLMDADAIGLLRKMVLDFKLSGGEPRGVLREIILTHLKKDFSHLNNNPIPDELKFVDRDEPDPEQSRFLKDRMITMMDSMEQKRVDQLVKGGMHEKLAKRKVTEERRTKPLTKEEKEIVKESEKAMDKRYRDLSRELPDFLKDIDKVVDAILNKDELNKI